ncbi:MAG: FAD-binding oxidoreductase, partial [Calditrichaeota bacterium]
MKRFRKTRPSTRAQVLERLNARFSPEDALQRPEDLEAFADDWTEIPGHPPDIVIKARSIQDVQFVLKLASETGTPVVPRVANTNIGGLAIPEKGGIVLDLTEMNRILEVNEADMYAVI